MKHEVSSLEENSFLKSLLWTARIYGAVLLSIVLYLAATEYVEELRNGASLLDQIRSIIDGGHILLFLPWVTASLGLIIAFWKEGVGGGISLLSFIGTIFTLGFHVAVLIVISMASVPSILFLLYWWKVSHTNRK